MVIAVDISLDSMWWPYSPKCAKSRSLPVLQILFLILFISLVVLSFVLPNKVNPFGNKVLLLAVLSDMIADIGASLFSVWAQLHLPQCLCTGD
jgi:hypothetical protein